MSISGRWWIECVTNVVCYEVQSVVNVARYERVFYDRVGYERGLLWTWSVMNGSLMNSSVYNGHRDFQVKAAENQASARWRTCSKDGNSSKSLATCKQLILQLPKVTFSLTGLWLSNVYQIHTDCEQESWEHMLLWDSNIQSEWLWFNSLDTHRNFGAGIQLLDGQ